MSCDGSQIASVVKIGFSLTVTEGTLGIMFSVKQSLQNSGTHVVEGAMGSVEVDS